MGRKKKDVMDEVLAFLANRGVDTTELPTETDKYDYRNNDAVVVFANVPTHFKPGICKNCKKPFAMNKAAVGFCSDLCRREDWTKTTGLPWRAVSTKDVWDGDPPMIITPQQMKNLEAIVDWFSKNRTSLTLVPESESIEDQGFEDQSHEIEVFLPDTVRIPEYPVHPRAYSQLETMKNSLGQELYHDSRTNLPSEPFDEVLEQKSLEEDLFGFS